MAHLKRRIQINDSVAVYVIGDDKCLVYHNGVDQYRVWFDLQSLVDQQHLIERLGADVFAAIVEKVL